MEHIASYCRRCQQKERIWKCGGKTGAENQRDDSLKVNPEREKQVKPSGHRKSGHTMKHNNIKQQMNKQIDNPFLSAR